jgi:hypothetical protein
VILLFLRLRLVDSEEESEEQELSRWGPATSVWRSGVLPYLVLGPLYSCKGTYLPGTYPHELFL